MAAILLTLLLWGGPCMAEGMNEPERISRLGLSWGSCFECGLGSREPGMTSRGAFTVRAARGGRDRWLAPDKAKHVVVSAVLVWGVYRLYHGELGNDRGDSRVVAAGITGLLGLGKELRDRRFSGRDLVADGVGIGVGLVLFTH